MSLNRYVLNGTLEDLRLGRRVLVVSGNPVLARAALEQTEQYVGVKPSQQADSDVHSVQRTPGREQIVGVKGGWIRYVSLHGELYRHLAADVLLLQRDLDPEVSDRIEFEARRTSPAVEVVRV